jgi:hypothetical protein
MPQLEFELHAWPGYPAPVVASVVRHAVSSASGGMGGGPVRVQANGPFAARVSVAATANLTGAIARSVEAALERLRDPLRGLLAGSPASLAAGTLQDLGFTHATDLDGGFEAWRAAGLPVEPATRADSG